MDDPFNKHWNIYKKRAGYQGVITEYLGKYLTEKYPNKCRTEFRSMLSIGHGEDFCTLRLQVKLFNEAHFYAKASVFIFNLKMPLLCRRRRN